MYLVFVRHGKAEYGRDDFHRELTPEGKETLIRYYPQMESLLRENFEDFDGMSKAVLSSPKLRALQTAQLLAEHFDIEPVEEAMELTNYSLAAALKRARQTACELVFLVGHDPMCSIWVSELCEKDISFRKGAAALVDYRKPDKMEKPLLWLISPHDFK